MDFPEISVLWLTLQDPIIPSVAIGTVPFSRAQGKEGGFWSALAVLYRLAVIAAGLRIHQLGDWKFGETKTSLLTINGFRQLVTGTVFLLG